MPAEKTERVQKAEMALLTALTIFFFVGSVLHVRAAEDAFVPRLDAGPATVGQPSEIRWSLSDKETGKPVPSRLTLSITNLEEGRRVFFINKVPVDGNFIMSFHFTDASKHGVMSVAELQGEGPIRVERTIQVMGLEPPRGAVLPPLILFLVVIALGLAGGRISRKGVRN